MVTIASDGAKALEAIEAAMAAAPFDACLMDVSMPVMDGLETTRELRQRETATGSHLCVIGLTAYTSAKDRQNCFEAGMDMYLTKPLNIESLRRCIEQSGQHGA